jgi:hypothetical protein
MNVNPLMMNLMNDYEKNQFVKNRFLIKALLISRFDDIIGPVIKYSVPHLDRDSLHALQIVPRMMDIMDVPFFTHNANNLFTANYFFTLPTFGIRGSMEQILITIVFRFQDIDEGLSSRIMIFLHHHREMLERMSSILRDNPSFKTSGLFSSNNELEVKRIMRSFYTSIFIEDAKNLFAADPSNTSILVMTSSSIESAEVFDKLRFTLQVLPRKTMRDELTLFMLNRLNFETYNCAESDNCITPCPECDRKFLESSAYIYLFNIENKNALDELHSIIKHVNTLNKRNEKLFLILGVIMSEEIVVDGSIFRTKSKAYHEIANVQFTRNCRLGIININDIDTYFDPVKWIIFDAL